MSLQPATEREQATPPGVVYTLTFSNGNQFSMRGECTACTGTFALTGGMLATGPQFGCLLIACQETPFDSRYKSLLIGNTTVAMSGPNLELSSLRGVLHFTR